jgi:hypothetical protein
MEFQEKLVNQVRLVFQASPALLVTKVLLVSQELKVPKVNLV